MGVIDPHEILLERNQLRELLKEVHEDLACMSFHLLVNKNWLIYKKLMGKLEPYKNDPII